jgi:hypothetical protein
LAAEVGAQTDSDVDYSQITRPVVQITDSDLIEYLLFELIIETAEPPTSLVVIDVTQNGYGPDDIIIAYPSVETFLIPEFLPDSVQQFMSAWAPEMEFRLDAGNLPSEALGALIEGGADTTKRAENAILFDVVQAVERNYRDLPVGLLFERDSIGFTFQIWDYNRDAMEYMPRPDFVPDSTVSTILASLTEIGYLPGWAGRRERSGETVASVSQALFGIRALPDEDTRVFAARTVLLGSYDLDRSGSIDAAREIDAIPCDVWISLDGTFPGVLDRFGFTGSGRPYRGNMVFSISERARAPVVRRAQACLAGVDPTATAPSDLAPLQQTAALPEPVNAYLAMETAAEIVNEAGATEEGSAAWAATVRAVLLSRFDTDTSGLLDGNGEVDAVPCVVWNAVASTHDAVIDDLGFESEEGFGGERIGIASTQRDRARTTMESCTTDDVETASRARPTVTRTPVGADEPIRSAAIPLAGLSSVPEIDDRELGARTILLGHYDRDRSGAIDSAIELDLIQCDVWGALDAIFPGFAERYGFVEARNAGTRYKGNLSFSISARIEGAASRRVAACARGETPPPTADTDVEGQRVMTLPVELVEFLDTQAAANLARSTTGLEPGTAAWASAVRGVLIGEYDADGSGTLDREIEVRAVSCKVWNTIEATYPSTLLGLGFDQPDQYLGNLMGVAITMRATAAEVILVCRP